MESVESLQSRFCTFINNKYIIFAVLFIRITSPSPFVKSKLNKIPGNSWIRTKQKRMFEPKSSSPACSARIGTTYYITRLVACRIVYFSLQPRTRYAHDVYCPGSIFSYTLFILYYTFLQQQQSRIRTSGR